MSSIIRVLVLKWLVGYIVTAGGKLADMLPGLKADINAKVGAFMLTLHAGFATPEVQECVDEILDAVAKLAQDHDDLGTLLAAVADKNVAAAEATLKAMLLTVTTGDLAKVVRAIPVG